MRESFQTYVQRAAISMCIGLSLGTTIGNIADGKWLIAIAGIVIVSVALWAWLTGGWVRGKEVARYIRTGR